MNKTFILLFLASCPLYSSYFSIKDWDGWETVVNGRRNLILSPFSIPSTSHQTPEGLLLLYCQSHPNCIKEQPRPDSPYYNLDTELTVSPPPTFKLPTAKQLRKKSKRHGSLAEKGSLK